MKLIGLTQRVDVIEAYDEKRDCLDQKWTELVLNCGYTPILLPNNLEAVKRITVNIPISGFILTGGNNLVEYGGNAYERDEVEKFLIELSIHKELPLLGVCRGMQVIQNYFGVKLEKINGHVATKHNLSINGEEVLKNSYHNFGTQNSVDALVVKARSDDGTVEVIEHCNNKIYGVMWHPERNKPFEDADLEFIKEIFN